MKKFKENFCVGGRHYSSRLSTEGDKEKTCQKITIRRCLKCIARESRTSKINTVAFEALC